MDVGKFVIIAPGNGILFCRERENYNKIVRIIRAFKGRKIGAFADYGTSMFGKRRSGVFPIFLQSGFVYVLSLSDTVNCHV